MKRHKKLQFLFLILTALVFSSQELEHIVFHSCAESHSYSSHNHETKHSPEIDDFTSSANKIFSKSICLICSSITGKSIAPVNAEAQLIKDNSLTYFKLYESFSFNSYSKPVSRGPPTA